MNLKDLKDYKVEDESPKSKPLNISDIGNDYQVEDSEDDGIGKLESGLRGVAQGASFGTSDELTGAGEATLKTLLGPEKFEDLLDNYRKHRDEARVSNKAAEEANPASYLTGEVAGGIGTGILTGGAGAVAGLGEAGLLAGAGRLALQGAAQGAATGLGSSEADLTKGDIAGAAKDTAIGGALGAGLGVALPVATKAVGKGLGAAGRYAMDKVDSLENLKAAYDLVGKGKSVVGKTAKNIINKDAEDIAKSLVKGGSKQVSEGSKMMGDILKTIPASDDIPQVLSEIEKRIQSKDMLPDDLSKLQNILDQYKTKTVKETIESGEDIARKGIANTVDQETSAAEMLGNKISFGEPVKTPQGRTFNTLKTTTDAEGNQISSVIPTSIPEDKVTKEVISKIKDMDLQQLYDFKKTQRDLLQSNKLDYTGSQSAKEAMTTIDNFIAEKLGTSGNEVFEQGKEQMKRGFQAKNILPSLDEQGNTLGQDTDLRVQKMLLSNSEDAPKNLDRAFGYLDDQYVSPELKESALELSKRNKLNRQANQIGWSPISWIKAGGIRVGELAGQANKALPKDFTRKILSNTDDGLKRLATKLPKELGSTLEKALNDTTKRDRLLWALSQQPAFREAVHKAEQDAINNTDETLGQ